MGVSTVTGLILSTFLSSLSLAQTAIDCPLLGPVYPTASNLGKTKAFQSAVQNFPAVLDQALASGLLDNETTSFSIGVYSANEENLLYSKHFEAPGLNGSLPSGQLNDDTIYRLGSVTKLVTVYSILAQNGDVDFANPITDYIPELKNATFKDEIDTVRWSEVTVGALASHLAGITRDYSLMDLAVVGGASLGLPVLNNSSVPVCGDYNNNEPVPTCSRVQYIAGVLSQRPLAKTFTTPIYSNSAFAILGWVLEKITNKSYQDAVQDLLFNPLNLTRSSASITPQDNNIITPYGSASQFFLDLGEGAAAAGAAYSSLGDLSALGRSILNSKLLSKSLTRHWMRPVTHTANPKVSVGAPWEILRYETPVSASSDITRWVDLYTKSGDVGLYSSLIGLDVDHQMGFSILVAGNNTSVVRDVLVTLMTETFVPAAEEAAREEANATFAGVYAGSKDGNNASLTLSVDDRPGLKFELTYNGVDFRTLLASVEGSAYAKASARLYPSGLVDGNRVGMTAVFAPTTSIDPSQDYFGFTCMPWVSVDALQYGGVGLDEYEVEIVDGKVQKVELLGLRMTLERAE